MGTLHGPGLKALEYRALNGTSDGVPDTSESKNRGRAHQTRTLSHEKERLTLNSCSRNGSYRLVMLGLVVIGMFGLAFGSGDAEGVLPVILSGCW